MSDYFDHPGLNWSSLVRGRKGRKCDIMLAMSRKEVKDSEALRLGTAFHELLLQGEVKSYAIKTGCKTTTIPDTITDYQLACVSNWANAVRDACREKKITWDPESAERAFFWEYEGVSCKAKIDCLDQEYIIDFKTTDDPEPRAFYWDLRDYAGQLAWYSFGFQMAYGERRPGMIIAVQKHLPNKVFFYRFPVHVLVDVFENDVKPLFRKYKDDTDTTVFDMTAEWAGEKGLVVGEGEMF